MLYIVLPQELSRRAMITLIQYMYTGEATVANDILNEVLKGGEILKIRGLCKVHNGSNEAFNSKPTSDPQVTNPAMHSCYQPYKLIENGSSATASPLKSNKSTPRNSVDKKSISIPEARSSSAMSHHHHILTQQESPVVVMTSSQPNPPQNYAQQIQQSQQSVMGNNQQQLQQSTTIIVKKDMAIDPGIDNNNPGNIPVEHYGLISLKIAAAVKKAQQQSITSLQKSPSSCSSGPSSSDNRREFYQIDDNLRYEAISSPPSFKVYTNSASVEQLQQDDLMRYTEKKKRIAQNQKPSSSAGIRENSKGKKFVEIKDNQHLQTLLQQNAGRENHQQIPEALSFLTIKEEPLEWTDFDTNGIAAQDVDNRTEIVTVKPETLEDIENSLGSELNDKVYSPLTCEVCNLKFQVPAAWVRHIESHSELNTAQTNVPKKRRRADEVRNYFKYIHDRKSYPKLRQTILFAIVQDENSENINVLTCDLCENISFATPGEWVRHVQNTHTETELAMSNNSILMKK